VPILHDRLDLPPDVAAVASEALILAGVGYAFFIERGTRNGFRSLKVLLPSFDRTAAN
jgi:hypothetical protein